MQLTVTVPSLDAPQEMTETFRRLYGDRKVFAFRGELGAGKTTLIKILCHDLGVDDDMSSPSFALVNEYASEEMGTIHHLDLYRLRSSEELLGIGWYDYLSSDALMFIEWPEMAEDKLPDDAVDVHVEVDPATDQRKLTITYSV